MGGIKVLLVLQELLVSMVLALPVVLQIRGLLVLEILEMPELQELMEINLLFFV
jgi:hypothetical protein